MAMVETMERAHVVTVEEIFSQYILNCFTPDDFWRMSDELWVEILPEIKEFFDGEGLEFPFVESDVEMLKSSVDEMFEVEFGKAE